MIEKCFWSLALLLLIFTTSQAQNNEDLSEYIETEKENIELAIELTSMRMELRPAEVEDFNPDNDYNFQNVSEAHAGESIEEIIEALTEIDIELRHPYNLVKFDFEKDEYAKYRGESRSYYSEHPEELPSYKPVKIRFQDGKTEKVKKYVSERALRETQEEGESDPKLSDLEHYLLEDQWYSPIERMGLYTSKPIKSMIVEVTVNIPGFTTYHLSQDGEIAETPGVKIELVGISGDEFAVILPGTLEDRYSILALYEDGRVLGDMFSSRNIGFTEQSVSKLNKLITFYDQALAEVENGNLDSIDDVQNFIESLMTKNKITFSETDRVIELHQSVRGPISEIVVKVRQEKVDKQTFTFEISADTEEDSKADFIVASDFKTEKFGILDLKGNWVVHPEFSDDFRAVGPHFYMDFTEDNDRIFYFFDSKKKKLHPVDFIPENDEPVLDRYYVIQKEANGPEGVFDVKTQKIVIPITDYRFTDMIADRYWLVQKTEHWSSKGVLDETGAVVVPPNHMEITYQDGFFYTEIYLSPEEYPDVYPRTRPDIYTLEGVNITQGKYNRISDKFSDGALLVKYEHYEESGKNAVTLKRVDWYFINTAGEVLAEFPNDEYKKIHPFENGLARIQDAVGFYGFIDPDGKVTLPFEYIFATDFKGSYALAQFNQDGKSTTAFIDKKGKVIITLPATFREIRYQDDQPYVLLNNGDTYDFEAKPF